MAPFWLLSEDPAKKGGIPGGGGGGAPIGVRGHNSYTFTSATQITMTTPTECVAGDLLVVFHAVHVAAASYIPYADDQTAGWTLLDFTRENDGGQDHRLQVFWKYATAGDAGGGNSYSFSIRNQSDPTTKISEIHWGGIVAFQGVRDAGTDLEFLYDFEFTPEDGGTGTEMTIGTFPDFNAYDGDGLLVCCACPEGNPVSITVPSEMTEVFSDATSGFGMAVAYQVVSTTTGDVGPKRFTWSNSNDHIGCAFILRPVGGTDERVGPAYTNFPKLRIGTDGVPAISFIMNDSNVGSTTIQPHHLTQEGDLLILVHGHDGGSGTADAAPDTSPTSQGWNELYSNNIVNDEATGIWWKWATADDAGTQPDEVLIEWGTTHGLQEAKTYMLTFRGNTITPDTADSFIGFLGQNSAGSGTTPTEPTYTVPFDNSLLLKVFCGGNNGDRRQSLEAQGFGQIIGGLPFSSGSTGSVHMFMAVEGRPVAGAAGGAVIQQDVSVEYDIAVIYISNGA